MIRSAIPTLLLAPDAPGGGAPTITPPGETPAPSGGEGNTPPGETPGAPTGDPGESGDTGTKPADEDDGLSAAFDNLDDKVGKPNDDDPPNNPDEGNPPTPDLEAITPDNTKLPANFRKRLGEVNTELQAIKKERDDLKAKLETGDTKQPEVLTAKIQELEKERDSLKGQIGMLKYEKSPEYLKQYETPFLEAVEDAREAVIGLDIAITDADGMQSTRAATWEDFSNLYALLNKAEAPEEKQAVYRKISEQFQGAAAEVKSHLVELNRQNKRAEKALASEKSNWQARKDQEAANEQVRAAKLNAAWKTLDTEVKAKKPDWFAEDKDDKEGNALLQEGYSIVNKYLAARGKMPVEDVMLLEAHIANRAAALPRMAHRVTQLQSKIESMQKIIDSYEKSGPGTGRRDGSERGKGGSRSFFDDKELSEAFN